MRWLLYGQIWLLDDNIRIADQNGLKCKEVSEWLCRDMLHVQWLDTVGFEAKQIKKCYTMSRLFLYVC